MKKTKIFVGASALVLGVTAFLATKANHKFNAFATAVTAGGHYVVATINGGNVFTTVATGSLNVKILVGGSTAKTLFTKINRTKVAYLKP